MRLLRWMMGTKRIKKMRLLRWMMGTKRIKKMRAEAMRAMAGKHAQG